MASSRFKRLVNRKVFLTFSTVLATLFGFGMSLAAPHVLPNDQYVQFGLFLGSAQVLTALCFEWVRLASLRYAFGPDVSLVAVRQATLNSVYLITATVLVSCGMLLLVSTVVLGLGPAFGVIVLIAAMLGVSDGRLAFARACHQDVIFSVSLLLRAVWGLLAFTVAGFITGDVYISLFALASSYVLSALVIDPAYLRRLRVDVSMTQLKVLAAYGVTASIASVIAIITPSVVRSAIVWSAGLDAAAGLVLGLDLSLKALAAVGMIISILLTQRLYRSAEYDLPENFRRSSEDHIASVLSILIPTAVGFIVMQPEIAAMLVPGELYSSYRLNIVELTLASLLLYMRVFGVDPVFYARGRPLLPTGITLVSLLSLGVATGSAAALYPGQPGIVIHAYFAVTAVCTLGSLLALRVRYDLRFPAREASIIIVSCVPMIVLGHLIMAATLSYAVLKMAVCGVSYVCIMAILNGCQWREKAVRATYRRSADVL